MSSSDLGALFEPRGVVVVGASTSPDKLGHAMAQSLESYPGGVRLVNAKPAPGMFGSVADAVGASSGIDLAVMCVPAPVTASALRESADAGVRAALVCAGGFAEVGGLGLDYANDVDRVVAETGIRVLGPNTSGFFVPGSSLFASFVPGVREFGPGSVAVVAASGGINHVLSFGLQQEGAGVSLGVGLGAGQDVTAPDVLRYLVGHEQTRAVILHVESIPDGRELMEAVAQLAAVKPVVALIVGRSDVSEFARSHTGALTTSWRTARFLLRQAGAIMVDDESHAVAAAIGLSRGRARANRSSGVGLVTAQAGPGLIIADGLLDGHARLPQLSGSTRARLSELLPPLTYQDNPVDTGRPGDTFAQVVGAVGSDPGIDVVGVYAITEPVVDLPRSVAASGTPASKPIIVAVDGTLADVSLARESARNAEVAIVRGPTALARALAAVVEDARLQAVTADPSPAVHVPLPEPEGGWGGEWDEVRAKDLLDSLGIPTPARSRCGTRDTAQAALRALDRPVAVKLVDATVMHKSDIGGVVLGVDSATAMDEALSALEARGAVEFLVEEMAAPGIELVVGARHDDVFGPVVVLGLGGVATEVLGDVSIRSAPVHPAAVADMIDDLATAELFDGHRGAPPIDRRALGEIVATIGRLVASGKVSEVEINPLRATSHGLIALDAVVLPAVVGKNGTEGD
ncbi:acetate--CoA ligase family protein [Microbacterium sp. SSM24]|uniref:acetate--CoA ligase family protein n=1 Tax=Microbacterium sp. SSM24 TaxID=2991714 RepID=UPI002227AE1E|nr:acetate--CoA ligase family protein [Microbacterium sp. SSM24]MCW3492677.1 acetate--CoA ligase family protein [Microbacterium sp. SSM24]